jgi:outer membrane lipoprotein-sorting protein
MTAQQTQGVQDPAARVILDRAATLTRQAKSIQADFELVIEDRKEKSKNSSSGSLVMKKSMYSITTKGSSILYNGKTMWTYMPEVHEVTITEPGINKEDFLSNPAAIFTLYNRDFKYRYVRETDLNGTRYHEIDLFPNNLNQPYSRIKIFVSLQSELPEIISSIGKDGIDYTVYLKNFQLDKEVSDAIFTFDAARYKKVEVIDMRGVK